MSLKDRLQTDIHRVFLNEDHFATRHTWNGVPVVCVVDDDAALKRKNNNVVDISYGENAVSKVIYISQEYFEPVVRTNADDARQKSLMRKPEANQLIYFDGKQMRIGEIIDNFGMYDITLHIQEGRAL